MDEKQLSKKHDRELIELLNEVRVALPGAQVLFAFLLIVPFNSRWETTTTHAQKASYVVALCATVLATVLLMAPTAYHRLRWRERDKERMLRSSQRLAVAGLVALAVAMVAAVYLVADEVIGGAWAVALTAVVGVTFALAWFALPLSTPYDRWDRDTDDPLA